VRDGRICEKDELARDGKARSKDDEAIVVALDAASGGSLHV
jgi:hypothetical protein